MQGFGAKTLESGVRYIAMHYTADEDKQGQWGPNQPGFGSKEWNREMELREDIYEGVPVFPDWDPQKHCTSLSIPLIQGSIYWGGWDLGTTRQPAFVLMQLTPQGQMHWILEVLPEKPCAMAEFAPVVRDRLKKHLPADWYDIRHYGDETGRTKSGSEGRSSFEVALDYGFAIAPVSNNWDPRERAVVWQLKDWITQNGERGQWEPRAIYSEKGCPVLVAGMRGAYEMRILKAGEVSGPGMVYGEPLKNYYSHCNDAHQYVCVKVREYLLGKVQSRITRRY